MMKLKDSSTDDINEEFVKSTAVEFLIKQVARVFQWAVGYFNKELEIFYWADFKKERGGHAKSIACIDWRKGMIY